MCLSLLTACLYSKGKRCYLINAQSSEKLVNGQLNMRHTKKNYEEYIYRGSAKNSLYTTPLIISNYILFSKKTVIGTVECGVTTLVMALSVHFFVSRLVIVKL